MRFRTSLLAAVVAGLVVLVVGAALVLMPATHGRAQDATATSADCDTSGTPYAVVQIDTQPRLDLELARTPQEHQVGLMYRESLPPDGGMLFVYPAQANEGYWMYHTLIPLSIAWIDRDGTIVDIQDMPRLNDPNDVTEAGSTVYNPAHPYWYALETNEGWFLQHGVGVGQQISFCLGS